MTSLNHDRPLYAKKLSFLRRKKEHRALGRTYRTPAVQKVVVLSTETVIQRLLARPRTMEG